MNEIIVQEFVEGLAINIYAKNKAILYHEILHLINYYETGYLNIDGAVFKRFALKLLHEESLNET